MWSSWQGKGCILRHTYFMSHIHTPGNRLVILNSQWHLEKLWNILHEESRLTFTYPPPPTPITILWTQGGKNTSVTFDLQVSLFSFGPSLCFYIHFSFCLCLFISFLVRLAGSFFLFPSQYFWKFCLVMLIVLAVYSRTLLFIHSILANPKLPVHPFWLNSQLKQYI